MQQTPKEKPKPDESKTDESEQATWSDDQKKHGYYYDDAYGYENFDPETPEDEDE